MRIVDKTVYYIRWRLSWINTLRNFRRDINKDFIPKLDIANKKAVAFIPHADDELIGLGTLLSSNKSIELIYFGYLGTNNTDENYNIRMAEFSKYCSFSNIKYSIYDASSIKKIKEAKIILLPSLVDWHEEHRKLNFYLRIYAVLMNYIRKLYGTTLVYIVLFLIKQNMFFKGIKNKEKNFVILRKYMSPKIVCRF